MYFLFSGEGATDTGSGKGIDTICEGDNYEPGPMTVITDQLYKTKHGKSFISDKRCGFISKKNLLKQAKTGKTRKKSVKLPGKKRKKETAYFYRAAYAFGVLAHEEQNNRNEKVIAVLFRDSDSQQRGLWQDKWQSMLNGFQDAAFEYGVPMLPKPISEAWLLCALKKNPYQNCSTLEKRSSSPDAKKPMKTELSKACNGKASRSALCALIEKGNVDARQINMPSFNAFKSRLIEVIQ